MALLSTRYNLVPLGIEHRPGVVFDVVITDNKQGLTTIRLLPFTLKATPKRMRLGSYQHRVKISFIWDREQRNPAGATAPDSTADISVEATDEKCYWIDAADGPTDATCTRKDARSD
jgi:hypothetical protein